MERHALSWSSVIERTRPQRVAPGRKRAFPIRLKCYAILDRRLRRFRSDGIRWRVALVEWAIALLEAVDRPGEAAPHHTHWVFPILHHDADALVRGLWERGFDATCGASSLCVVPAPADRPETRPVEAERALEQMVFLPVYEGLSRRDVARLSRAVLDGGRLGGRVSSSPRRQATA